MLTFGEQTTKNVDQDLYNIGLAMPQTNTHVLEMASPIPFCKIVFYVTGFDLECSHTDMAIRKQPL